jgi:hypothetical protein
VAWYCPVFLWVTNETSCLNFNIIPVIMLSFLRFVKSLFSLAFLYCYRVPLNQFLVMYILHMYVRVCMHAYVFIYLCTYVGGCIHKFQDWPPGARTANGTAVTRCSCIAILWVSLVSFAAVTLCVVSQRVFIVVVYFVIDSVRKLLDTSSYVCWLQMCCYAYSSMPAFLFVFMLAVALL